jgi:hypothetical protein
MSYSGYGCVPAHTAVYWVAVVVGTVLACIVGGLGTAALVGCFDRE